MTPAGRRRKGDRVERMLVEAHVANRIPAKRVPLSGAQEGWEGDILIADRLRAEVKARRAGQGFKVILRWMATTTCCSCGKTGRRRSSSWTGIFTSA